VALDGSETIAAPAVRGAVLIFPGHADSYVTIRILAAPIPA